MSPSNDIAALYEAHARSPLSAAPFSHSATLLYVATGTGGQGIANVKVFLDLVNEGGDRDEQDREIVDRTVGRDSVVEESVVTVVVGRGTVHWLCPGADLKTVLGRRVKIPLVTAVKFDAHGKIESKRVYWDQATALAQIGILSPAVIRNDDLPVLVKEDASALVLKPQQSAFNRLAKTELTEELKNLAIKENNAVDREEVSSNILNQGSVPVQYRLSSRVNQPGGTGGKSSIFSDEPEERKTIPADPRRNESQISFGGESNDAASVRSNAAARHNESSHFVDGQQQQRDHVAGKAQYPEKSNVTQFNIGGENDGGNPTDISITGARKRPGSGAAQGTQQQQQQPASFDLGAANQPNQSRPSSRVLRPPGGGSTITFG